MEIMQHVQNIQYEYLLNKYLKCNVWRLAVRYDIYMTLGGKLTVGLRALSCCRHSLVGLQVCKF
jgi:hypothetical protein